MEFSLYFPPEYLRAGLLVSLLSVWLLVGLFAYLNHYTKRRYFTIWTTAWLFYALWLTMNFSLDGPPGSPQDRLVEMCRQWCVGASAVFLFWGSLVFMGQRVRPTLLGLFLLFLVVWSFVGTYHVDNPLQAKLPIFGMLGVASFRAAFCFFKYRQRREYIGATLLAVGLLLWGVYLGGTPFWDQDEHLRAGSFFLCGLLQLFIAISMIILVLEEARASQQRLLESNRNNRAACLGLQNQVRVTEDRYRKLFEQASDGIVITTTTGLDILELNPRAKHLLALRQFEPGRCSLCAFFESHAENGTPVSGPEHFERIRRERTLNLVAPDGTATPVEAEAMAIEFDGQSAYQFTFRELTERVRLEQQLRQSEKLSALGQLISGVAHELNNPLAVINGYVDLILAHHELKDRTREDLKKVAQQSRRATKLVGNFLTFARGRPAQRVEVNLNEIVEGVAELRQFDLRSANVELSLDLTSGLPTTHADPDQIQQVLMNLTTNAIQAMTRLPRPPRILLKTDRINGLLRVLVEDNGPGVPPDLETKIFEPFFTTKVVGQGTGLGLSLAHSYMMVHNGRIYYQRSSLGGACFVMEIPVVRTPEAPPVEGHTDFIRRETPTLATVPARILVLDDEEYLAEMLGQMLEVLGHRPTLCHNPIQALELLARESFDLILSDYRMPELDGQQFYRRVAQNMPALAARIIFLTGDVMNEETQSFLNSVGNAHLTKPFRLQVVEAAITRILQQETAVAGKEGGCEEVSCID